MKELNDWFRENRRDLPWRIDPTPYRVWISEVMLQQTRASVVIPYFERWMALFPDIKSLAEAMIESVIKTWEGLGYYSRAQYKRKHAPGRFDAIAAGVRLVTQLNSLLRP